MAEDLVEIQQEDLEGASSDELIEMIMEFKEALQGVMRDRDDAYRDAGPGETRELLQEIETLTSDKERLVEELEVAKSEGSGSGARMDALEEENKRLNQEVLMKEQNIVRMRSEIDQAEAKANQLSTQLHNEQEKARKKVREASKSGKGEREKSRELAQALEESRQLREEIEALEADRETLISALEEIHTELTKAEKEKDDATTALHDAEKREELYKDEIREARTKLMAAEDERHELEKIQAEHTVFVEKLQEKHDEDTAEMRRNLKVEQKKVMTLQEENERMRDNTQVGALQRKLSKAEELLKVRNGDIKTLKEQLSVGTEELSKVAEKFVDLEDNFNEQLQSRVKAESRKITSLEQLLQQEKERTNLVRTQCEELQEQLAEEQREKADLERTTHLYEQGHGLEQAVAQQKAMKKEIKSLERQLLKTNRMLSSQMELSDMLEETAGRLKQELGLPRDFKYDDIVLKEGIRTEVERLTSLNTMWQQQNKDLENERLRLLKALRDQAQLLSLSKGDGGGGSGKSFGLNADQLLKMNEFVAQLKEGKAMKDIVVYDDKSAKLQEELRALQLEHTKVLAHLDMLSAEHEENVQHLKDAQEKGFVAGHAKIRSVHIERPTRKKKKGRSHSSSDEEEDHRSEDSGPDVEASGDSTSKKSRKKKQGPTINFEGTEEFMSMNKENFQNILNELEKTHDENQELRAMIPQLISDSLKEIKGTLAEAVAAKTKEKLARMTPDHSPRPDRGATAPTPSQPAQPSARTLESRKRSDELQAEMLKMEKKMDEMIKSKEAQAGVAGDAAAAKEADERHQAELRKVMEAQSSTMREMTKQVHEQHELAAAAEAEVGALHRKLQEMEDRLHRSEVSKANLERELEENSEHSEQPSGFASSARGDRKKPARIQTQAFTPAIKGLAQMPLDQSMYASYREPKSPSAKMMHQVQMSTLQLPPEDWADELSNVNAQLIEALEELAGKEDELQEVSSKLAEVTDKLKDIHAKETLLYREHIAVKKSFKDDTDRLSKKLENSEAEREKAAVKAARLDQLVAVLESEDGEGDPFAKLRDTVRDLTRQVAAYEVNQAIMARKHNLLKEENVGLHKLYNNVNTDFLDSTRTLKLRILYLELWRKGAQSSIEENQRLMDRMVPRDHFERTNRELTAVKERYKELLLREAEVRTTRAAERDLPRRLQEYKMKYDQLLIEVKKMESMRDLAKEEAASCLRLLEERQRVGQQSNKQDVASLLANIDSLTFLVARQKGNSAELKVLLESEKSKNKSYRDEVERTRKDRDNLQRRCNHLDDEIQRAHSARNEALDALRVLEDEWQGGAKREERLALEDALAKREAMYDGLARDAQQGQEMADISLQQVASLENARNDAKTELEQLRKQLREIGSKTDEGSIIGKLTLENVNLKVKYQQLASNYDLVRADLNRGNLAKQKLEQALDAKDAKLRETRSQCRARIVASDRALERLKEELHPSSGSSAGLFERLEQMNEQIRQLSEVGEENEKGLRTAEEARFRLEGEVQARNLEIESLSATIKDLRGLIDTNRSSSVLHESHFPLPDQAPGDLLPMSGSKGIARRLLTLADELKTAKLLVLRQKRELQLLRDENKHLKRREKKNVASLQALEADLVQAQTVGRQRELENLRDTEIDEEAKEVQELNKTFIAHEVSDESNKLSESFHFSSTASKPKSAAPSTDYSKTIERLEEYQKQNSIQTRRINELESAVRTAEDKLATANEKLRSAEQKAGLYSNQLREEGLPILEGTDGPIGGGPLEASITPRGRKQRAPGTPGTEAARSQFYARETQKLTEAAKQTITQLKSMLEKKTKMVNDYKERLSEQQTRFQAEKVQDQEEIRRLTDRLYDENNTAIEKLREAFSKLEGSTNDASMRAGGVNLSLMEAMDGLTDAVAKKDRQLQTLEGEVAAKSHQLQLAEQRAGQALSELDELRRRAGYLQRQVDNKSTQKLVEQLKRQSREKDKKVASLREAIVRLKEEFVKAEENRELDKIKMEEQVQVQEVDGGESSGPSNRERDEMTRRMKDKVESLQDRMKHVRGELDVATRKAKKLQDGRESMMRQVEDLRDQVQEQATTMAEQLDTINDLKRQLSEAKRKSTQLREQISATKKAASTTRGSSSGAVGTRASDEKIRVLEAQLQAYKSELARMEATKSDAVRSPTEAQATRAPQSTGPASRAAWEAEKRLRKRAETLSARLQEKREELDIALKTAEKAKTQLARCQKEKSALESKLASGGGARGDSKSLTKALSDLQSSEEVRKKVFELERKCSELRRVAEVEKEGDIRRLRSDKDVLKTKVKGLEDDLESARRRVRQLERSVGGTSEGKEADAAYLRSSVERFERDEALRDELDALRSEYRALESRLIERDNLVLELRFDTETAKAEQAGYNRRILELEASNRALVAQVGSDGDDSRSSRPRQAGDRFKRERDLEGVIDSQNRVIMKLQAENERLARKGVSTSKLQEKTKEVRELKAVVQSLEEEKEKLLDRAASASEARMGSARLKEQVSQMRKDLKRKGEELSNLRKEVDEVRTGKSRLQNELEQANEQIYRNRLKRESGRGESDKAETDRLATDLADAESRVTSLERQLADAQSELRKRERDLERIERSSTSTSDARLVENNRSLREENAKLRDELSSFDMEFFEEIEDLKYNYHEVSEENKRLRDRIRRLED